MYGLKAFSALVPSRTSVVTSAPFLAALLAPAATLFDIPALSQRWYELNGEQQSDPAASLILSAISLAFSVMANTLLVIRFTIDNPRRWRMAIRISTMGWFLKTAVGLANLIVFGATRRNGSGYVYIEGFWCAILSCILSGIVTLLLSAQYMLNKQDRPEGSVNLDCRMLIMSEMILFGVMALEALIFSRVEGWSYLDGLYFSVVSLLTIGFGNFAPTKTSTKILLFPFSIIGIALLSNQVTLITSVSSRMTSRYRQQLNYGPTLHRKLTRQLTLLGNKVDGLRGGGKDKDKNGGDDKAPFPALSSSPTSTSSRQTDDELMCEVKRLKHIHAMQQGASELFEFLFSLLLLVVFWFVSGAVFQAIEHWTFGDAMYFSYVFFLTIGYGDFAPNTPAGKTLFVFWAMLAVPIMTNFVVQTIQTIVSRVSTLITNRARERRTEWYDYVATYFVPHTDLVDQIRRDIDEETSRAQEKDDDEEKENQQQKTSSISFNDKTTASEKTAAEVEAEAASPSSANTMLLRRLMNKSSENEEDTVTVSRADLLAALEQSILLESECRAMLIDQMKTGSAQWLLLKADTNLQQNHAIVHRVKQSAARGGRKKKHHKRKNNNGPTDKEKREKEAEEDEQINDSNADPHLVKELQKTSSKSMIERVNTYRQTYARFLVLAGRLMDLHGQQLLEWEHDTEEQGRELIG